jgi:hypothetical protein
VLLRVPALHFVWRWSTLAYSSLLKGPVKASFTVDAHNWELGCVEFVELRLSRRRGAFPPGLGTGISLAHPGANLPASQMLDATV